MEEDAATARIMRERAEQGFGPKVEDPDVLAKVAKLLADDSEAAAA